MALVNRQNDTNVPPELAPYYNKSSGGSRLIGRIIRIALIVIAIILVVLLARWGWHKVHHAGTAKKPTTSQAQLGDDKTKAPAAKTPAQNSATSTPKTQSSNTGPAPGNREAAGSTTANNQSSSASSPQSTPTTIPDTGPGETAAAFMIALIAGTIGYQIYLRYRITSKSSV